MRTTFGGIAVGEIDSIPGCSQLAVFHSAFVLPACRGQGVGHLAHQERLKTAKEALYDCAICTVDQKNEYQERILQESGWVKVWSFQSSKTQHSVGVWMKNL